MTPLALLLQAAVGQPVTANVQLGCTLVLPGAAPVAMEVDLQTKKPGSAALVAPVGGPFGRVSATSDAVRGAAGVVAFSFATGAGQYRLELTFAGDPAAGRARARIVAVQPGGAQPVAAQGFCNLRGGKRLQIKQLVRMSFDATPRASSPATLKPLPLGIQSGACQLVAPDRRVHPVSYTVLTATGNEATVAYKFDDPAWLGLAGGAGTGTGVQFHLASDTDHLVVRTIRLEAQPPLTVRTSFERSGNWIDVTRAGAIVAQGECGPAIAAILASPQGK